MILIQELRLAFYVKALLSEILDQGLHIDYLVIVSDLDPMEHPV
jgi:hypothetical protein